MKIAFIVDIFPAVSQTFILNQITGLIELGHEVAVYSMSDPNENKIHHDVKKYSLIEKTRYLNMPVNLFHRFIKAKMIAFRLFFTAPVLLLRSMNVFRYGRNAKNLSNFFLTDLFRGEKFDILHCHFGPNGINGIFLKDCGVTKRVITSFHGHDINSYPKIAGSQVYSALFEKGDLFTSNTNFTKSKLIESGCSEDKITVLPVGFKISNFTVSNKNYSAGDTVKILTVGRLVEKKGYEYSIRAISKLIARYKKVEYYIGGSGPLKQYLFDLVKKLGIEKDVIFLGAVDQDEVIELYKKSHIFLLPSVTAADGDMEGQALVLQEAQAAGIPVISTLHNGIPEGVLDGKSGFLVPEKNADALYEKLCYMVDHPDLWAEMGKQGREFVLEKYNIDELNKKLEMIYSEVITRDL